MKGGGREGGNDCYISMRSDPVIDEVIIVDR